MMMMMMMIEEKNRNSTALFVIWNNVNAAAIHFNHTKLSHHSQWWHSFDSAVNDVKSCSKLNYCSHQSKAIIFFASSIIALQIRAVQQYNTHSIQTNSHYNILIRSQWTHLVTRKCRCLRWHLSCLKFHSVFLCSARLLRIHIRCNAPLLSALNNIKPQVNRVNWNTKLKKMAMAL